MLGQTYQMQSRLTQRAPSQRTAAQKRHEFLKGRLRESPSVCLLFVAAIQSDFDKKKGPFVKVTNEILVLLIVLQDVEVGILCMFVCMYVCTYVGLHICIFICCHMCIGLLYNVGLYLIFHPKLRNEELIISPSVSQTNKQTNKQTKTCRPAQHTLLHVSAHQQHFFLQQYQNNAGTSVHLTELSCYSDIATFETFITKMGM